MKMLVIIMCYVSVYMCLAIPCFSNRRDQTVLFLKKTNMQLNLEYVYCKGEKKILVSSLLNIKLASAWLKRPLFEHLKKTEIFRTYFSNTIWLFDCLSLVKHPRWLQSPEPLQTFWGGCVGGSRSRSLQPASFFGRKHLQGRECEALQETGRHTC